MGERKQDKYVISDKKARNFYRSGRITGDIFDLLPEDHKKWFKQVNEPIDELEEMVVNTRPGTGRFTTLTEPFDPEIQSRTISRMMHTDRRYHTRFTTSALVQIVRSIHNGNNNIGLPILAGTTSPNGFYVPTIDNHYAIAIDSNFYDVTQFDAALETYNTSQTQSIVHHALSVDFEDDEEELEEDSVDSFGEF